MSEWIKVEDRLPDEKDVLCYVNGGGHVIAHHAVYSPDDQWWLDNGGGSHDVTHWMPLPEPPA